MNAPGTSRAPRDAGAWQRWMHRPETLPAHRALFIAHRWAGLVLSVYVLLMGATGSVLVYLPQIERSGGGNSARVDAMEWIASLHENLLAGAVGRVVNGVGALSVLLVTLTGLVVWWRGTEHWRRSLSVSFRASFVRLNWDLHNALGFWLALPAAVWAVSGAYFCFPEAFNAMATALEPGMATNRLGWPDTALYWLASLHFGRFDAATRAVWAAAGLVMASLAATGVAMYGHRVLAGNAPAAANAARRS